MKLTDEQIAKIDAILLAVDAIVYKELGKKWTLAKHMARKRELLNIVEEETGLLHYN